MTRLIFIVGDGANGSSVTIDGLKFEAFRYLSRM